MCTMNQKTKIDLIEENSLVYLKNAVEKKEKYDIVLIDGDHNYKTVKEECMHLKNLYHHNTLFIFDDYNGRYSNKDMFYSKRPGYEEKNQLIKESGKEQGIKKPIDDFIDQENLVSFIIMKAEPLCVIHKANKIILNKQGDDSGKES